MIGLAVWIGASFVRNYYRNYEARQEIVRLESEIRAYEIRNQQLEMEISRLQSPEYVERVAREELGLVYPGERLYIVDEIPASD